jgi:hypothetical protein
MARRCIWHARCSWHHSRELRHLSTGTGAVWMLLQVLRLLLLRCLLLLLLCVAVRVWRYVADCIRRHCVCALCKCDEAVSGNPVCLQGKNEEAM